MRQNLILKAQGLYTHPNNLSAPEGSMTIARNVVIDQDSVVSPRRGLKKLQYDYSVPSDRALGLIPFQEKLLSIRTGGVLAYYDSSTGWVDATGSYLPPSGALNVRYAQSQSNLYLSTSSGVFALDAFNGSPYRAGMPRGLDLSQTLTGASGFLSNDSQVAYRVVWGRKDLNQNLVLGAPSQRGTVSNSSGGTRDVSINITIPSSITTSDFVQVYRSLGSSGATIEPNDELYLVYEANPTAGEITARSLTFVDSTPDDLVGVTLYTSPSQEGLVQANEPPPLAKDIAFFKNSLFFMNTASKHRLFLTLLAVGGAAGVQLNDTVTIQGQTYTAKAAEDVANREFQLSTGGSPAQNIAATSESLVRCINKNTANTSVYAYIVSGFDDLPGKMLIEERSIGGSLFSITAPARGAAYSPTVPVSGTSVSSTNDVRKNFVSFSKIGESEAVPLVNNIPCGSAFQEIIRGVPLRDSLIVFSQGGIFRITGSDPSSFTAELIDSTAILLAPESVAVLNNQVMALTTQGVVAVSDVGVQVLSRPIEIDLLRLQGADLNAVRNVSFGIGYESERKYMLWTIKAAADTFARQAFVFNLFTNTWTTWEKDVRCGLVDPIKDLLLLGSASSASVLEERKTFSFTDFQDEQIDVTVSAVSGKVLTLASTVGIEMGDLLYQAADKYSQVVSVTSSTIEVLDDRAFTAGNRQVLKRISTQVEWNPLTAQNPGILKHWSDVTLMFKDLGFSTALVGFKTEISPGITNTTVSGSPEAGWGLFPWGQAPWGGGTSSRNIRTLVAKDKAVCSQLNLSFRHDCAYTKYALSGVSLMFLPISERVTR